MRRTIFFILTLASFAVEAQDDTVVATYKRCDNLAHACVREQWVYRGQDLDDDSTDTATITRPDITSAGKLEVVVDDDVTESKVAGTPRQYKEDLITWEVKGGVHGVGHVDVIEGDKVVEQWPLFSVQDNFFSKSIVTHTMFIPDGTILRIVREISNNRQWQPRVEHRVLSLPDGTELYDITYTIQ